MLPNPVFASLQFSSLVDCLRDKLVNARGPPGRCPIIKPTGTFDETGRIGRILKLSRDIVTALFHATLQGAAETIPGVSPCMFRSHPEIRMIPRCRVPLSLTHGRRERKHRFRDSEESAESRDNFRSVMP
jgi:hypothetical protein